MGSLVKRTHASAGYVGPYPPNKGGVAQHGARLVGALGNQVSRIMVVSWRRQYPPILYPGTEATVDRALRSHYLTWWSPFTWLRARHELKSVDVVVFQWITPAHALPLRIITTGLRGARVAVVHNAEPHEAFPFTRSALRSVLGSADAIIAHSNAVAQQVTAVLPGVEVSVVPLPPNIDIRCLPLPESETPRLLFFGFVRPYKGLELLLEAMRVLRERGQRMFLTVAGETWREPSEYVAIAHGLGIEDLVDFQFGYVADRAVEALFADHHIVVQPYLSASQSAVVPLAFAAGRPVVVTPVGGLSETVFTGVNGVVADEVSPGSVASAIHDCFGSLRDLAEGALASSRSWEEVAIAVLEAGIGTTDE